VSAGTPRRSASGASVPSSESGATLNAFDSIGVHVVVELIDQVVHLLVADDGPHAIVAAVAGREVQLVGYPHLGVIADTPERVVLDQDLSVQVVIHEHRQHGSDRRRRSSIGRQRRDRTLHLS
jgi:hypothetical protein